LNKFTISVGAPILKKTPALADPSVFGKVNFSHKDLFVLAAGFFEDLPKGVTHKRAAPKLEFSFFANAVYGCYMNAV
jgi:hypothetical protein